MSHDETQEPAPPAPPAPTAVDRQVPKVRYIFILAIISSYIAALVMLIYGFVETFNILRQILFSGGHFGINQAKLEFIEVIDVFLLATILYVIASGFYQLFLSRGLNIEPWLKVNSVGELEVKLIGVLITILGVTGLAGVVSWDGQSDLLPFGATVALIIAALAFYASRAHH